MTININPKEYSTAFLTGRRAWMQRNVDSLTEEIEAMDAELVTRVTVQAFDMSNDVYQNFDVWGVVDGLGQLLFVSVYEASAREWAAQP